MALSVPPPQALPAAAPARPLTLHIVEDDTAVRAALRLLARCFGWQAQGYASGHDFLASAVDEADALVVLDLNMPGMDGEEVLRRLRARGSRIPVLVITGDRQGERLERLRRNGAQDVLLKPFGGDAFQHAVEACLPSAAPGGSPEGSQPVAARSLGT